MENHSFQTALNAVNLASKHCLGRIPEALSMGCCKIWDTGLLSWGWVGGRFLPIMVSFPCTWAITCVGHRAALDHSVVSDDNSC